MAFSITVESMQTVTVAVTGESYDALIALTTDCAQSSSCLEVGDDSENVTYTNTSGATEIVYLLVDGWASGSGTYDLEVTVN
jgi:hypothetical protein